MSNGGVWKIAAGVALGLAIWTAVDRALTVWQARQAMAAFAEAVRASDVESRELERRARIQQYQASAQQAQLRQADAAAKSLGPDERCVAGTVLRRLQAPAPGYQQELARDGKPIRCAGASRL